MGVAVVRRLRILEVENRKLRLLAAGLSLDQQMLQSKNAHQGPGPEPGELRLPVPPRPPATGRLGSEPQAGLPAPLPGGPDAAEQEALAARVAPEAR